MIYRILLLLCALAAADTVPPCDVSLIRGVKAEEINVIPDNVGIQATQYLCVSDGKTMKGFKIGSKIYDKLHCHEEDEWSHDSPFAAVNASFDAACVEYCKWTGSGITEVLDPAEPRRMLSCTDPSHYIFYGESIFRPAAKISCALWEWKVDDNLLDFTNDFEKQRHFECKKVPCPLPFGGAVSLQSHYDEQTSKLTCKSTEDTLMRIKSTLNTEIEKVKSFTCANGKWKYNDKEMADPLSPPQFSCIEECILDGFAAPMERFQKKVVTRGTEEYLEVTCADRLNEEIRYPKPTTREVLIEDDRLGAILDPRYKTVREDISTPIDRNVAVCHWGKWMDGNLVLIENGYNSRFSCAAARDCSVVQPTEGIEFVENFLHEGLRQNKVTCASSGRALRAVLFKSIQYTALICDSYGWFDPGMEKTDDRIAKRDKPLDATCAEYCASTGEGLKVELIANTTAHVTCEDTNAKLMYGTKTIAGGAAICTRGKGWMAESESLSSDIATPAQFECKSAPTTTTTTATNEATATAKEESVNGSTTAPDVMIARIVLLALFRSLFMNI